MIKLILIISMLVIAEASSTSEFKMLSEEENYVRLETCGILKHPSPGDHETMARDAPWLVKIHHENVSKSFSSGFMISRRHILADLSILNHYDNSLKLRDNPKCEDGVIDLKTLNVTGRENLRVEIEICKGDDCKEVWRFTHALSTELLFGDCADFNSTLLLFEIKANPSITPICLPNHKKPSEDEPVHLQIYDKISHSEKAHFKPCGKYICTAENMAVVDVTNDFGVGMSARWDNRETLVAIGKHSYLDPRDGTGGFVGISDFHEKTICQHTGICPSLKPEPTRILVTSEASQSSPEATVPSSTSNTSQMSQSPPEATQKSRIIEDWPPPIPTIRPPVRLTPVDFLPQNKEDYDDEEQLLLEYEQIEREEREKEEKMEEKKKGSEGWHVLMGVGITVLIALI